MKDLDIHDGDRLILESNSMKRKALLENNLSTNNNEKIELICTTRVFELDGIPIRKVKVIVNLNSTCKELIDDVSILWGKSNLKFKFGRIVLYPDKTFYEIGVCNNAEIVITGGRG
jgi:hypothetical protein